MKLQHLAIQEYPCQEACRPPYAPKLGCCSTCKVTLCRTAFTKGMVTQGEKAYEQFNEALTQLVLDYHIPDEVAERYLKIFEKKLNL